jgi:hypothetical protein
MTIKSHSQLLKLKNSSMPSSIAVHVFQVHPYEEDSKEKNELLSSLLFIKKSLVDQLL